MSIPQTFVQELLARADVVEIVGRYVPLKKGGVNFMHSFNDLMTNEDSNATAAGLPKGKARQVDLGHGNTYQIFALATNQVVTAHIFAQVLFDLSPHNLTKT